MASKAVNRPTDNAQKELDVNNKLQLYGIYSAFAQGKVPSNKQIDVAMNSFLESRALSKPSGKLSEEGQKLVADVRDVVEKAKILLLTKNDGNLLQDFIWQTQQISGGNTSLPNAPVGKDVAKQHGNEALEGLRTLGTLVISNGQFRKLREYHLTIHTTCFIFYEWEPSLTFGTQRANISKCLMLQSFYDQSPVMLPRRPPARFSHQSTNSTNLTSQPRTTHGTRSQTCPGAT
jgi:hypothetical protein